jgi:hypothetical protein
VTWPNDAANLRQMLDDYLGKKSKRIEMIVTENNSVSSNPGKQTTSLVNGLFRADALGNLLQTEFNGLMWWDLRNGQSAGNNNNSTLYGWRAYGDYGIADSTNPAGPADLYPTFYVDKLLTHFTRGGESVVQAQSDYLGLGVYAVKDEDHRLNILVINKHPTAALNTTITIPALKKGEQAKLFSYGIPQDTAAQTGTGSADVQESSLTLQGRALTFSPGPYSASVIQISKRERSRHDKSDDVWGDDDDDRD